MEVFEVFSGSAQIYRCAAIVTCSKTNCHINNFLRLMNKERTGHGKMPCPFYVSDDFAVVLQRGIPFEMKLPQTAPLNYGSLTREQFDAEMEKGMADVKVGRIYAAGQTLRIMKTIRSLEEMPMRHQLYGEEPWHSRGIRFLPVDNYLIFYLPEGPQNTVKYGVFLAE